MKSILFIISISLLKSTFTQFDASLGEIHRLGLMTSGNLPLSTGKLGASTGFLYEAKMFPKLYLGASLIVSKQNYDEADACFYNFEWLFCAMYKPFKYKINPVFGLGMDIKKRAFDDEQFTNFTDYIIGVDMKVKNFVVNPGMRYSNMFFKDFDIVYFFCNVCIIISKK